MTDLLFDTPVRTAAELAPPMEARRNACAHCGRPFGLVRHRLAMKQLCSQPCMAAAAADMQRALKDRVRRFNPIARSA